MYETLMDFAQFTIDGLATLLNTIFILFPPSPFKFVVNGAFAEYIAKINYFLPVYEFVAIGQAWVLAVGMFYVVALAARWLNAIEG